MRNGNVEHHTDAIAPRSKSETHSVVGKKMRRTDTWNKVTGQEQYMEDINLPNALWGKILRSPHAHANIKSIDTSEAEKFPGVKAIITFKDIVPYKDRIR